MELLEAELVERPHLEIAVRAANDLQLAALAREPDKLPEIAHGGQPVGGIDVGSQLALPNHYSLLWRLISEAPLPESTGPYANPATRLDQFFAVGIEC